jgi:quercetin dioxygenase-like cupin family protein
MTRTNLFTEDWREEGDSQVSYVYKSPSLKILKFRFDPGQSLLLYSDETPGKVSLFVLGGRGEFAGEGTRRYSIETGDIVVSELSEPNNLLATTDMSVLVTVTPLARSCDMETREPLFS